MCTFLDKKKDEAVKMRKELEQIMFEDAEKKVPSIMGLMEIVSALPEALANIPSDKIPELVPKVMEIQEVVVQAKSQSEAEEGTAAHAAPAESPNSSPERESSDAESDMQDMDPDKMEGEDPKKDEDPEKKFSDSKEFQDAVATQAKAIADQQMKEYSEVMHKAKTFLDDSYDYAGKTPLMIMKDCIKTQIDTEFTDAEVPVAFKALKKSVTYANFGDSAIDPKSNGSFVEAGEKEYNSK